MAATEVMLE